MTCLLDRAKGSASRIVFQDEQCWGTVDRSGAQQPRGLDFVSETLRNSINTIESQIIRSSRMRQAPQQGNHRPGGDINGEFQPNVWPILLRHALCRNGDVVTAGSGPYTHTFSGGVDLDDGITVEKRFGFRDSGDLCLQFQGGRVNEFFWAAPTEGIVTCRAGLLFKKMQQVYPDNSTGSTDDDSIEDLAAAEYAAAGVNEPFNSFHCAIEIDDEAIATITTMDFLLTNNFDGEAFALNGTPYRADLTEDLRAINGNITCFFTWDAFGIFHDAFMDNETLSIRCTMSRGDQEVEIFLPAVKIGGDVTPAIPGRGPMSMNFTYNAFEDEDRGTDIEVTVTNRESKLNTSV